MQDAQAQPPRNRPKLDLSLAPGGNKDRKRGKSMFGLLLGTLNKAKNEDKERNASEAAKKRQMIEQRLQAKLKKETDSVRRAEEVKKEKNTANRKEEDLQLKDSIYKLRRTRLPILANFLSTSDRIPDDPEDPLVTSNPLAEPPRTHPPPLYYLPAILTPVQEAFINARKSLVKEAVEKEWATFKQERATGIEEIRQLRQRVAEEEARRKEERASGDADKDEVHDEKPEGDAEKAPSKEEEMSATDVHPENSDSADKTKTPEDGTMDVDDEAGKDENAKPEAVVRADDEEAVEY
ncbi:hypothetical protein PUNSTDRAFT_121786 [Punctularia strigosozonata HHB-11173 SS5]|uniref:uncharacterized protein n=1 Tax=Punctularia strigosozonata (strain HHB-11173) TaxID=741275 RepID=UPI0004416BAA|nr:uncharacterized protein PUNSTDRAFT_121786 [Punctularia strigosozonata HHB-11173 SS5]EIN06644.1 hypothetical protein PUNSTDRAFT_121786 [Punctularia strigosozonata HHB-11173 SS5]